MWVEVVISRVEVETDPCSERAKEEQEVFWIKLGHLIAKRENYEVFCLMGNLNVRIGDGKIGK